VSDSNPVFLEAQSAVTQWRGSAQRGSLGVFASSIVPLQGAGERSRATMQLDDLIFSGPGSGPIDVQLMLAVDGAMSVGRPDLPFGFFNLSAGAIFSVDGALNGVKLTDDNVGLGFIGNINAQLIHHIATGVTVNVAREGVLSNFGDVDFDGETLTVMGSTIFDSKPISVPLDNPVRLRLMAGVQAVSAGGRQTTADFSQSLTFPTTGPVFLLPDGFTVNSESGLIVDNQWLGGPAQTSPIPEPSSLALLGFGAGLLGIGGYVRRRKTASAA
jgi:hypothetical protein